MNAPLLNVDNLGAYVDLLPEGFAAETQKRKELLNRNRQETKKGVEVVKKTCDSLSSKFGSLQNSFEKNSHSYSRLQRANRKNYIAYSSLGDQLKDLSQKLKTCGEAIRKSYPVSA